MFGYVIANRQELKLREYDEYRSFYCGLCKALKDKYGTKGQVTLTYDLTFLVMLLTDLYQETPRQDFCRCVVHPLEKHPTLTSSYTDYAADMNVLLSYYQCLDNWDDEKKLSSRAEAAALESSYKKICARYSDKVGVIEEQLVQLNTYEKNNFGNIDDVSGCFGKMMAEVFAYNHDEWEPDLRHTGFYLGKFIYLMDAYEDLEGDLKNGRYNPLSLLDQSSDFDEKCSQLLTMMMAEACKSFERLPLLDYAPILSNILYSGVWSRYEQLNLKRKDSKDHV